VKTCHCKYNENHKIFSELKYGQTEATSYFPWGLKQLQHEVNHWPPLNIEVKNVWSFIFTPPIHLHGMVLRHTTFTFMDTS
jgi:hypothetical protein